MTITTLRPNGTTAQPHAAAVSAPTNPAVLYFFLVIRQPPPSTLFPYTTALPISGYAWRWRPGPSEARPDDRPDRGLGPLPAPVGHGRGQGGARDRKSTRLNSSHVAISYAVFCLKKKIARRRGR